MSPVLPGFTCPKCQVFTGSEQGWRPTCRACSYSEPPHCAVCRSEDVAAICPEHGPRCYEHIETHGYCDKMLKLP
jgi:hypothetical protein